MISKIFPFISQKLSWKAMITPTNMATTPQVMEATMNHLVVWSSNSMVTFRVAFGSLVILMLWILCVGDISGCRVRRWGRQLIVSKWNQRILIGTGIPALPNPQE